MLNKEQAQAVGDGSTAVQAGGNVVITQVGLSYTEVRDVAFLPAGGPCHGDSQGESNRDYRGLP